MYARVETDDDDTDTASGDDAVVYRSREPERPREHEREHSLAATLRERLFGKGKDRADAHGRVRFITTVPGMAGAGETETESEDVVSRTAALRALYILCTASIVSSSKIGHSSGLVTMVMSLKGSSELFTRRSFMGSE